jgi:hypothetical protein
MCFNLQTYTHTHYILQSTDMLSERSAVAIEFSGVSSLVSADKSEKKTIFNHLGLVFRLVKTGMPKQTRGSKIYKKAPKQKKPFPRPVRPIPTAAITRCLTLHSRDQMKLKPLKLRTSNFFRSTFCFWVCTSYRVGRYWPVYWSWQSGWRGPPLCTLLFTLFVTELSMTVVTQDTKFDPLTLLLRVKP